MRGGVESLNAAVAAAIVLYVALGRRIDGADNRYI
jgi:tRNA G18 (ribose-2'-O)-methylase SpoU